jgi:hypothetical protein
VAGDRTGADGFADAPLEDRVAIEKARALAEPGPGWRTWFLQRALRAYYLLGILIANAQVVVFWIEVQNLAVSILVVGAVLSLAVALYLELLLYRYFWYRPRVDVSRVRRFRRTWLHPFEYGRWTPEADLVAAGEPIYQTEEGPSAKEFL